MAEQPQYCPQCGTANPLDSKFCKACGAALISSHEASTPSVPVAEPIQPLFAVPVPPVVGRLLAPHETVLGAFPVSTVMMDGKPVGRGKRVLVVTTERLLYFVRERPTAGDMRPTSLSAVTACHVETTARGSFLDVSTVGPRIRFGDTGQGFVGADQLINAARMSPPHGSPPSPPTFVPLRGATPIPAEQRPPAMTTHLPRSQAHGAPPRFDLSRPRTGVLTPPPDDGMPTRPMSSRKILVIVSVFAIVAFGFLYAVESSLHNNSAAGTSATATDTPDPSLSQSQSQSQPTDTVQPQPADTATPAAPSQGNGFGDGTYTVGTDIQPGVYHTDGNAGCYWARLNNTDTSSTSNIIVNDNASGPVMLQIKATDAAFETTNCGTWTPAGEWSTPALSSFDDGTYAVGTQIQSGLYRTDGADGCYWERSSSLGWAGSSIIANDNATGPAIVAIAPGDAGFKTKGCGTWTLASADGNNTGVVTSFGDGTWRVGDDIKPGSYHTDGADGCYYETLAGFGGGMSSVIRNDNATGPVDLTFDASTVGIKSKGCGTWTRTGA